MKSTPSEPSLVTQSPVIKTSQPWITCVVPAFNEAAGISDFINELCAYLAKLTARYDVIVVDDGSNDGTGLGTPPK